MTASDTDPDRFDPRLRTSLKTVALVGGGFALGALGIAGAGAGISVAVGAVVAVLNLWALARVVLALLPRGSAGARTQSRAGWALVAALKMAGLFVVLWVVFTRGLVSPLPVLIGFGSLPIGIAIGSLVSDRSRLSASASESAED